MFQKTVTAVFELYDWCYRRFHGLERTDSRAGSIIVFHKRIYAGERILLSDGAKISPGDSVIEIHVYQRRAREMQDNAGNSRHAGVRLRREFRESLSTLAKIIERDPRYRTVCAITGTTILAREARYFGFSTIGKKNDRPWARLAAANAEALIGRIRNAGSAVNDRPKRRRHPVTILMSRKTLMSRYQPQTV